jgi:DNA-binding NarL/FixJ family response regulator
MPVPDDEQIRAAAARQRVEFSQNRAFEDDGRARRAQSVPLRERAEFPFGDRSRSDLRVVGEAGDGAEAIGLLRSIDVDLIVLDVSMPRLTGLQAASAISRAHPGVKVLMLSMHDNEQYLFEALKAGASGYVLKTAADRDLVEPRRAVLRGQPFLYPSAITALIGDYLERARDGEATPEDPLTPREVEVVKLIAEAHTNEQIAGLLHVSRKTVERHRENILGKLGMRDRVELTRYAIRRGLVEP